MRVLSILLLVLSFALWPSVQAEDPQNGGGDAPECQAPDIDPQQGRIMWCDADGNWRPIGCLIKTCDFDP